MTEERAALFSALVEAQRALCALDLDGRTGGRHAYRYATAEAVIAQCREALHAHGLALVGPISSTVRIGELAPSVSVQTGEALDAPVTVAVEEAYTLAHESGAAVDLEASHVVVGRGSHPPDVGALVASARTYALRDVLRGALCAPKGREEDLSRAAQGESGGRHTPRERSPYAHARPVGSPVRVPARHAGATAQDPAQDPAQDHGTAQDQDHDTAQDQDQSSGAPSPAASSRDLEEALLRERGWDDSTARELCADEDGEPAPVEALRHVVQAVSSSGLSADELRAAWAQAGVELDRARAAMIGKEAVSAGELRAFAVHRKNGGGS